MGTVDGPGVRMVVFLQGCPMRCLYCHNPDSWKIKSGKVWEISEVINQFNSKRLFYKNGGITFSGGEPLMQIEELITICKKLHDENVHVCVDTSGIMFSNDFYKDKIKELIEYVDLFLIDVKTINERFHEELTKNKLQPVINFIHFLDKHHKKMWVRHVVVPGLTTNETDLINLGKFVSKLNNVEKIQLLPYHSMAKFKYDELNIKYPLIDVKDCDSNTLKEARKNFLLGLKS